MTPQAPDPWREVAAAQMPLAGLAALAPLRHRQDVRVLITGDFAWVRWPAGKPEVARQLLPVPGLRLFSYRDGAWHPFGALVPTSEAPPDGEGVSVAAVLVPGRFAPVQVGEVDWPPVALTVARCADPRPTAALVCAVGELARWADSATTAELAAVRAARSGERVILLGERLPSLPRAVRFWGKGVMAPLGFRPDPALPEAALREAAGASREELLFLDETGAEVVPLAAFEPLTRAGLRLGAET
jgi:hypothetical protein